MDDQELALKRVQQLRWLVPLLATLMLVWLEAYFLLVKHVPLGRVLLDLALGFALAWTLSWFGFAWVLTAQRAAADRSREMAALNLIGSRLSAAVHLKDILSISLDGLLQISGCEAGGIYVRSEKGWKLAIQQGVPEEALPSAGSLSEDDPWIRSVVEARDALVQRVESDSEGEDGAASSPWHSYLSLPCFVKAEAVAIISLFSRRGEPFSPETLRLLPMMATQVGMALERGRLLDEAQDRLRERELLLGTVQEIATVPDLDTLLPRILSIAMEAIPSAEKGTIHLYDKERDELVVRASVGFSEESWRVLGLKLGEGFAGWAYLHREPLLLADALGDWRYRSVEVPGDPAKSGICAPLAAQGGVIGTVFLDSSSHCEAFGEDDLRLLTAFASSAAVAIERAHALQEARRLAAESGMLLIITQLLTSSPELDQVMRHAVEEGAGLLRADACSLSLYDPTSELLTVQASEGLNRDEVQKLTVPMSRYKAAEEALRSGLSVAIEYALTDDRLPRGAARALGIKSTLVAPLLSRGAPVGVLAFHQTKVRRSFSDGDEQLALRLGYQAASAIENARLFARIDRARQEWELTFNSISDAIFIVDGQADITQANEPAARLAGKPLQELIGQRYYQEIYGRDEAPDRCVLAEVLRTGEPARGEPRDLLAEGAYQVRAYPIRDAHGNMQGAVSILHDITVEQRLRQELLHAEKLSSLGQTIAGVAHELNNPLQSVVGYSELLKADESLSEEARGDAMRVFEAGQRAATIVRNLLIFARKHECQREVTSLNQTIRSVLDLQARQLEAEQIEVVADLADDLPSCYADKHQLQQVWYNLIVNAEQAILRGRDHGVLTIRSLLKDADTLRVEIVDDGPGIPEGIVSRLFDPFFTTRKIGEGTGLGLAVCFGIVQAHGGRIWVESEEGRGATFIVELPIRQPEA